MTPLPTLDELQHALAEQNEQLRFCEELAAAISADVRIDATALAAFDDVAAPVVAPLPIINGVRA